MCVWDVAAIGLVSTIFYEWMVAANGLVSIGFYGNTGRDGIGLEVAHVQHVDSNTHARTGGEREGREHAPKVRAQRQLELVVGARLVVLLCRRACQRGELARLVGQRFQGLGLRRRGCAVTRRAALPRDPPAWKPWTQLFAGYPCATHCRTQHQPSAGSPPPVIAPAPVNPPCTCAHTHPHNPHAHAHDHRCTPLP